MPKWVVYSILTMVFWGSWGVVSKVSMDMMSPLVNQILFTIGLLPVAFATALSKNAFTGTNKLKGSTFAFVTGILSAVGNITLFEAFSRGGKAAVVVPLTGLYPLLTIVAALLLLKERLSGYQIAGIVVAASSILLFSA